ncbi:MAG TPA: UvrB/UvrC motif-containing protein [Longimicrobiales bacterium]
MSRRAELRAHVREHARDLPGVYRMLGPSGEVLYVGKSVRVRTRLLSYFRARRGEKAAEIVGHAHRIEWDYVPDEFAALLTELRQIKRWRPLYNVEHKRDRQYCFIKRTREAAPRLLLTGDVADDGALYFGPFRGRTRVRDAIRELSDLLELRDCRGSTRMRFADQLELFRRDDPPGCYRGEIRRCLAPCAGRCTRAEYLARVDLACRFLEGDGDAPLIALHDRMRQAAERLQFEYAAVLRDRAARLDAVRRELLALRGGVQAMTRVYRVTGHDGQDRLYLIRRGLVRAEFAWPRTPEDRERIAETIREALAELDATPYRLDPHQAAEILLVARWFRLHPAERDRLLDPATLLETRQTA